MDQATSLSLLDRVATSADSESWDGLVAMYRPLLARWLRSYDVQPADAEDLIQEVLTVVVQEVGSFDHNERAGAFRSWLRRILVNRLRNFWRKRNNAPQAKGTSSLLEQLQQLEDDSSALSRVWNTEHDQHVIGQLMETVRPRFEPQTWEAFRRLVFDGQRADAVARELGLSLSSVYVARSRVLSTLRREADGLVDSI
jgi:RNA polymerase sigma-70 factor (ECF subfamily)